MNHVTIAQMLWIYFAAISLISVGITVADKLLAISHSRRVPEATLLLFAVLGGSVAMLLTMFVIRHKTRKLKFMAGIPLIILLQAAASLAVWYFLFLPR